MPKQILKINRVLSHCLWAIKKLQGSVTPSEAEGIYMSAKQGEPAPEATME